MKAKKAGPIKTARQKQAGDGKPARRGKIKSAEKKAVAPRTKKSGTRKDSQKPKNPPPATIRPVPAPRSKQKLTETPLALAVLPPATQTEPARPATNVKPVPASARVSTAPPQGASGVDPLNGRLEGSSSMPTPANPANEASVQAPPPKPELQAQPSVQPKKAPNPFYIPPILLEGDQPSSTPLPAAAAAPEATEASAQPPSKATEPLPEFYGTGRLILTARDPWCLYANWDLKAEQLRYLTSSAIGRHLILRVFAHRFGGELVSEIPLNPESTHWFIHVQRPGTAYVVELGCYTAPGQWKSIALSEPVSTPSNAPAAQPIVPVFADFSFAPPQRPYTPPSPESTGSWPQWEQHQRPDQSHQPAVQQPWTEALGTNVPVQVQSHQQVARDFGFPASPGPVPAPATPPQSVSAEYGLPVLTEEQEQELLNLIGFQVYRPDATGSAEVAELVKGQRERHRAVSISSAEVGGLMPGPGAQPPAPSSAEAIPPVTITSPGELMPVKPVSFWFNVNAELVIYGATEPDAQVSIGGRPIRLRPDGTFSYRFSLPDGDYQLPIRAQATHGDTREAELSFRRATRYGGEVGVHPQDFALRPPTVENVS